ncbi:1,2-phenylacetyl-CoA epoxidase subunit PaaD [Solimonas soli]|uniref:1,2-phenylacetyl-CoA epoxidase subunit PaaD n=1 Tax=Solimonas soli TaxID=413479 RepID=UPI0004822F87|nr:1,2-phenylacetyl-CoA epoxidase subunit PaaD [Solimonas soli]
MLVRSDAVTTPVRQVWDWLAEVPDPEIPAVSVVDLGIVREVSWSGDPSQECLVAVTPTYSGCPATEVIARTIAETLKERGIPQVRVETRLAPAWTTDWLTPEAREKLRRYGIAPPVGQAAAAEHVVDLSRIRRQGGLPTPIVCPHCGSTHTECVSAFGSTPCKALYRCHACKEPFDYFKCH